MFMALVSRRRSGLTSPWTRPRQPAAAARAHEEPPGQYPVRLAAGRSEGRAARHERAHRGRLACRRPSPAQAGRRLRYSTRRERNCNAAEGAAPAASGYGRSADLEARRRRCATRRRGTPQAVRAASRRPGAACTFHATMDACSGTRSSGSDLRAMAAQTTPASALMMCRGRGRRGGRSSIADVKPVLRPKVVRPRAPGDSAGRSPR